MNFAAWSRSLFSVALPVWLFAAVALPDGAAQGLQVDVEEFKRLQGEVADLKDANVSYQKRISELTRKIDKLQEDMRNANERSTMKLGDMVTREELKKAIDRIAEVDEKRENDRKVILEQFDKLEKSLMTALSSGSHARGSSSRNGTRERDREREPEKEAKAEVIEGTFLPYKVKPDETLGQIIQEFNVFLKKEGRPTIGLSAVRKANPNLNLDRIFVGQTIQLPVPDKK